MGVLEHKSSPVEKEGLMLEKVDFNVSPISKEEYKPVHDELVKRLVVLQQQAHAKGVGLVVLFEGWGGAGKGGRISDLLYNLDARHTNVHVTEPPEAKQVKKFAKMGPKKKGYGVKGYYPSMQQFWDSLCMRGNMTIYDRGWYTTNIEEHLALYNLKELSAEALSDEVMPSIKNSIDSVASFERQLTDDGYIVVKFFLHVSRKTLKKRLQGLNSDPSTAWRVTKDDLKQIDEYDSYYQIYDKLLPVTHFDNAPWV